MQFSSKPQHKHTILAICKIDTGAELNVISKSDYHNITPNPKQRKLKPPSAKITAFGGPEVKSYGTCQLYIHHNGKVEPIGPIAETVPNLSVV